MCIAANVQRPKAQLSKLVGMVGGEVVTSVARAHVLVGGPMMKHMPRPAKMSQDAIAVMEEWLLSTVERYQLPEDKEFAIQLRAAK